MRCTFNEQIREVLDVKSLAALDEGIQQVDNGQRWSIDEAFEVVLKRRKLATLEGVKAGGR